MKKDIDTLIAEERAEIIAKYERVRWTISIHIYWCMCSRRVVIKQLPVFALYPKNCIAHIVLQSLFGGTMNGDQHLLFKR